MSRSSVVNNFHVALIFMSYFVGSPCKELYNYNFVEHVSLLNRASEIQTCCKTTCVNKRNVFDTSRSMKRLSHIHSLRQLNLRGNELCNNERYLSKVRGINRYYLY